MSNAHPWRVIVTPRAERELKRLPPSEQVPIRRAVDALATDPRRGDVRKLQGRESEWRLRVGEWRVRFQRDPQSRILVLLRVLHRSQAYRE